MVKPGLQAQRQAQELLFHRKNGFDARTRNITITSARIKTFPFLELALVLALHFSRENGTHEERTRNLSEIFFIKALVPGLFVVIPRLWRPKRFSETVQQVPVIYDNGSFVLVSALVLA